MQLTVAALIMFVAGACASPIAAPEPEPFCFHRGQACWKLKRATEAFTNSIRTSGGVMARSSEASNLPGGAAFAAKTSIVDLANLIALAENDPESFYTQLDLENELQMESHTDDKEKREASPEPFCFHRGQACWKAKREASPEPFCFHRGQACWKAKREASPEPFCFHRGQACWKAKRAADAVVDAIAEAEKEESLSKREPEPWCFIRGGHCWKAATQLDAIGKAARSISIGYE